MITSAFYKKMLVKVYHFTKNKEAAEDIVQTAALNILKSNNIIQHFQAYFVTSMYRAWLQLRVKNNNTLYYNSSFLENIPDTTEYRDIFAIERLRDGVSKMPEKQQAVFRHILNDNNIGSNNTIKSHYFFGIRRLREHVLKKGA